MKVTIVAGKTRKTFKTVKSAMRYAKKHRVVAVIVTQ